MTVPRTVLAVALLLLLAFTVDAARAAVLSTGPYDVRPGTSFQYYLLWFPPYAVPMNLTFLNVTWFRPEAIWFKGRYPVRVCGGECRYELATIYVVQDGVRMDPFRVQRPRLIAEFIGWHIKNRYCALGTAMVAPIKIIELSPITQIWISDVYCLYGNNWFWLRLLPYIFREDLIAEGVEAVEFRDPRIFVRVPAAPPGDYVIPGGWYLDPATKRVFRIPSNDTAVMAELQWAKMRASELEAELANKTARLVQLNATLIQLNATIAQLNVALAEARSAPAQLAAENQRLKAQLEELNATRIQLEAEVNAYKSQLEALRTAVAAQLTQLTAENQALKAQIASMNEALARLNEAYASQTAQLRSQLETWTRAAWIGAALGAAAGAAAAALALRRRK
jgi:cell division protein FtsB